MSDRTQFFKYNCRDCQIRRRCIDAKSFGPGLKVSIAQRFESRTDTFETWELLQQDCLLVRSDKKTATYENQTDTGLGRRLREARQTSQKSSPTTMLTAPLDAEHLPVEPVHPTLTRRPIAATATPCGLTLGVSERVVRLPQMGDIVLGRFTPRTSVPPDIDLAFEDGDVPSVSRRHALVTGRDGQHWIEDLGSRNGTHINGHPLPPGNSIQLAPGDRLLLGRCRLSYSALPQLALNLDPRIPHSTFLVVTHTGQQIELPEASEVIVGRPDPALGYVPDVDLGVAGEVGSYVSRKHVKVITFEGRHYVLELGSSSGTRLNGKPIRVGDTMVMLQHADQLWLGGCVVAYEWRLHG